MKKLGILSVATLAMVLSAFPAQAQPVRASDMSAWGPTTMLSSGSVATSKKAHKVSYMTDTGTALGAGGLVVGTAALIVAATRKRNITVPPPTVIICRSPGGSCTVQ